MKTLCLILLFRASLQLQCDKREVTGHIGGEILLICKYNTNNFLFSRKYWCRGDSRATCHIMVDSERVDRTGRFHVVDARRRGLFVKLTDLRFDDAGVYWVGIDKIYADIMTSVNVIVTEVPVSKPRLWPLTSLADRPTCWGRPVTVRCGSRRGTGVDYAWYRRARPEDLLLQQSSDLNLHCGNVEEDSGFYCVARNEVGSQGSDVASVQVPMAADSGCIYVVHIQGPHSFWSNLTSATKPGSSDNQPIYDCADRMSTTTLAKPLPLTACQASMNLHADTRNQSLLTNQTHQDPFLSRAWTELPLWYSLLRTSVFASLLIFLCIFFICTIPGHKKQGKRKKKKGKRKQKH